MKIFTLEGIYHFSVTWKAFSLWHKSFSHAKQLRNSYTYHNTCVWKNKACVAFFFLTISLWLIMVICCICTPPPQFYGVLIHRAVQCIPVFYYKCKALTLWFTIAFFMTLWARYDWPLPEQRWYIILYKVIVGKLPIHFSNVFCSSTNGYQIWSSCLLMCLVF